MWEGGGKEESDGGKVDPGAAERGWVVGDGSIPQLYGIRISMALVRIVKTFVTRRVRVSTLRMRLEAASSSHFPNLQAAVRWSWRSLPYDVFAFKIHCSLKPNVKTSGIVE